MGNVFFSPHIPLLNIIIFKLIWIIVNRWVQQKHIESINNLRAHNRSVFKGLLVIVKNQSAKQISEYVLNQFIEMWSKE